MCLLHACYICLLVAFHLPKYGGKTLWQRRAVGAFALHQTHVWCSKTCIVSSGLTGITCRSKFKGYTSIQKYKTKELFLKKWAVIWGVLVLGGLQWFTILSMFNLTSTLTSSACARRSSPRRSKFTNLDLAKSYGGNASQRIHWSLENVWIHWALASTTGTRLRNLTWSVNVTGWPNNMNALKESWSYSFSTFRLLSLHSILLQIYPFSAYALLPQRSRKSAIHAAPRSLRCRHGV
jgi:hypothetical protein